MLSNPPLTPEERIARLRQRAAREKAAREEAEALLEEKSRQLYALNRELEVRVAQRTAELDEARLAAEAASRAKSTFLAVMSHEIRTPLNGVLGLSSILLEASLPDEQKKLISLIHETGDSLLNILNDILDFSKLEAGEISLESIPFSPRQIIESAVAIIEPRAIDKGIRLVTAVGSGLPEAMLGDAGRLRQVVINLLSNAVKFTSSGSVTISLTCKEMAGNSACIEWSIVDTGIGIAPDRVGLLFNDFVQADNTIGRRFGGSGLGLAICRRIIERMGGEIAINSTLGQGTTVQFTTKLPTTQPSETNRSSDIALAALKSRIDGLGRKLCVLIADDNATNRLVAQKMVQSLDVETRMVCNGLEAIEAASEMTFDVILMDVQMPEMDGLLATRTLRERGLLVPVIGFTANAFADDIKACVDAGMDGFVAKPVRKAVLLEEIGRALTARAPRAAA